MKKVIAALIIVTLAISTAQTQAAEATVGADFMSAYVFRGITYNDGFVIQPMIDVAAENGLSYNVWANWDVDDYNGAVNNNDFQEIDLSVAYALPLPSDSVEASFTVSSFSFPGSELESTSEAILDVSVTVIEHVSVGLQVAYEFDEVDDVYAAACIGLNLPVTEDVSINLGAKAGYVGSDYSVTGEEGFQEYEISLATTIPVGEDIEVSAMLNYVDNIDEDVLPDAAMDTDVYGGIGVYYSF
ncbi:MAG: TorF family putative porin [Verrucomicrobia bacterium]|nr:TorF family putative porin [Verrucomicrobiota bacterium]